MHMQTIGKGLCYVTMEQRRQHPEYSVAAFVPRISIVAIVTITNQRCKLVRLRHDCGIEGLKHSRENARNSNLPVTVVFLRSSEAADVSPQG